MIFILLTTIFTLTYVAQAQTATPTTAPNDFWDIMIGDTCYCDTGEELDSTYSKSKQSKSKEPSGYGPGRCSCKKNDGITEMRIIYELTNGDDVDITFLYDDNITPICTTFMSVEEGNEITCAPGNQYDDTTYIKVHNTVSMTDCTSEISTPCKKNGDKKNMIIGDTGTTYCGIIISGWKDPDNEGIGHDGFCDDGVEPCECSFNPTNAPSIAPSIGPSNSPSISPTQSPSIAPSIAPIISPSIAPSISPSIAPSNAPSIAPSISPS
eukprot:8848_1